MDGVHRQGPLGGRFGEIVQNGFPQKAEIRAAPFVADVSQPRPLGARVAFTYVGLSRCHWRRLRKLLVWWLVVDCWLCSNVFSAWLRLGSLSFEWRLVMYAIHFGLEGRLAPQRALADRSLCGEFLSAIVVRWWNLLDWPVRWPILHRIRQSAARRGHPGRFVIMRTALVC